MSEADIRHNPPGQPRRGGRLAIFSSIVLVVFGVLIGLYFYDAMQAERRLAAAIAAADLSDPYWRLEDLEAQRAVLQDENNSAVVAAAEAERLTGC